MYVRDTDPLPPNSQTATGCASWASQLQASMAASIANAQAASASIAGPASFTQFGPNVVIDVARSQNAMSAAGVAVAPSETPSPSQYFQSVNVADEIMSAPTVLPLNVTEEEYGGCCGTRNIAGLSRSVATPSVLTMPQRAPLPVVIPPNGAMPAAPKYKNLCWALRNGAVDPSQFDPSEFQALQYRCTQQGYAGACVPPPLTALWLDQQRRAGTLPHISVPQTALDAIPIAPDLTGVSCSDSWTLGGMAGLRRRGMGAPWGDAGSMPSTPGWPSPAQGMTGWGALLFFGAIGLGLYAVANR